MGLIHEDIFICVDCETTGLDARNDHIIEVAVVKFAGKEVIAEFESLVDPGVPIPAESTSIHHITDSMVAGKPKIEEILPEILQLIGTHIVVGHGVRFDLDLLWQASKKHRVPCILEKTTIVDTLRLARLYGQTPVNSLDKLREHFNIPLEGAHRAMNDVRVNIEVFRHLTHQFKTTTSLLERLKKPIPLKVMPLGKYKGRIFKDIPIEYLSWAVHQDFDGDLMFSLQQELRKRKQGNNFTQASNPFSTL